MEVLPAVVTIPGNEILGTKDKIQHYIVIGEGQNKIKVRCGEENYNAVQELQKGGKK